MSFVHGFIPSNNRVGPSITYILEDNTICIQVFLPILFLSAQKVAYLTCRYLNIWF